MLRPRHAAVAVAVSALLALLSSAAGGGDTIVLRLATTAPEGSPWADACQQLTSGIEKASKGQVRMKLFRSGLLGEELETAQQLQAGTLDLYAGSSSSLVEALPELGVLEMPFLFADLAEVDRALVRVLPSLGKAVAQRGFRIVGSTDVGFRHVGSKTPVQSLTDLRRLRLRSQPAPLHARLWTLLGVKHHPLGLPSVARALEDGTIDAICSDHTPVDEDAKQLPFGESEAGATGLELLLALTLKWSEESRIALPKAIAKVTTEPARILGIGAVAIAAGANADLCIFDPHLRWKVEPSRLKSQGKNTPFAGYEVKGRVRYTLVGGHIVYEA